MPLDGRTLGLLYHRAHNRMRDAEGFLPQEAFDELLKFLFYRESIETQGNGAHLAGAHDAAESASAIRQRFRAELSSHAPWAARLWPGADFHSSDAMLLDLQSSFAHVVLTKLPLDVRSTALSTFLSSESRRGLGIFPTPIEVVRAMIEIVNPQPNETIVDPACGTGTFLLESARILSERPKQSAVTMYGLDKNPRMYFLTYLNLRYAPNIVFRGTCVDSLRDLCRANIDAGTVDVVLTNPPFGVKVSRHRKVPDLFEGEVSIPDEQPKVPSEVLFLELCLRLLKPGGRLGIVLPRSVLTNDRLSEIRSSIDEIGYLTDILDLPAETFASTGAGTTTVAAFFKKHGQRRSRSGVAIRVCHITNVGFDGTGRPRDANQLTGIAATLSRGDNPGPPSVTTHVDVSPTTTLQQAARLLFRRNVFRAGPQLRTYVQFANTGKTPSRTAYSDSGTFILKVGNLTGRGINWTPRDRNFVSPDEGVKRTTRDSLMLRIGDIVLTSSAHAARYIARKVDIVAEVPNNIGPVTFVGEIIRIRPLADIDPFILLATLRIPLIRDTIQACVRGQTAHLSPNDLMDVMVPYDLRTPSAELLELSDLLRREAALAFQLNKLSTRAAQILRSTNSSLV